MARILHQLRVLGKNVYPYTDLAAVLDNDGRNLKDILKTITNKFDELELSVSNGALQGPKGEDGTPGQNVELRKGNNAIQWKLDNEDEWKDLISLQELIPNGSLEDEEGNIIKIIDLATKEWVNNNISDRIIDNFDSDDSDKALSARQGKILKGSVDTILKYINDGIEGNGSCNIQSDIEIRNLNNKLEWRKSSTDEWELLLDISTLGSESEKEQISLIVEELFSSRISTNIDKDDDSKLLTVKQGRTLQSSIKDIYDYIINLGLGVNVDNDITPLEPEFREYNSFIQWRIKDSEDDWINLFEIKNNSVTEKIIIEDNLLSTNKDKALSANQGRVLNDKIFSITQLLSSINGGSSGDCINGKDGKSVEIRNNKNIIQWKYTEDTEWIDLLDINEIINYKLNISVIDNLNDSSKENALSANQGRILNNKLSNMIEFIGNLGLDPNTGVAGIQGPKGEDGRNIELQKNNNFIQWKYIGDSQWNDLISLSDLGCDDLNIDLSNYIETSSIVNSLTDDSITKPLSAKQGKILNEEIKKIRELLLNNNDNLPTIPDISIVDNLLDGGKDKALSAEQGKILNNKLSDIKDLLKSNIELNKKVIMSTISPGYINDVNENIIYEENEWTSNSFLQVKPNSVYQLKGDSNTNIIRWYFYKISDNKLKIHSVESSNKNYVTILVPDNCFYIKIGFNTNVPEKTFSVFSLKPI